MTNDDGLTICYICQTPIGAGESVPYKGEKVHEGCAPTAM